MDKSSLSMERVNALNDQDHSPILFILNPFNTVRLLSYKANGRNKFGNHLNPVMLVFVA